MERTQLEAFLAVAAHGGFTRAAESLFVTQPAVTRQVAALELELHTRLFDRQGRTVRLTAAGQALHRYAADVIRLLGEAERAVDDVVTGAAGHLAIGANSTTATYTLPPILGAFRLRYPGVELSVHTGVSARVVEMVRANQVDLGIASNVPAESGLVSIPLCANETGVVVYPEHPLAARPHPQADREPLQAGELAGCPLILMEEGTNLRTYVDGLLSAAGVAERATMEMDNVEAIKKMIEARLGISLLPLVSVAVEVAAGRLVALRLAGVPSVNRRLSAIHRRDRYLSAALSGFIAVLQAELVSHVTPAEMPDER